MTKKILFVYKWATMGGVERVILNRVLSLTKKNINLKFDVFFLEDAGGKKQFKDFIRIYHLDDFLEIKDSVNYDSYDLVFSIDTPEVLGKIDDKKLFVECHTAYRKNRQYLKDLSSDIRGILVPSEFMIKELRRIVPVGLKQKIYRMSNEIVLFGEELEESNKIEKIFAKIPALYLGRMDKSKNVEQVIKIISDYNQLVEDKLILLLVGEIIEHEINLDRLLKRYNMLSKTIYLPPINFAKTTKLMQLIKANKGIFISASPDESFGLSAAEAMSNGIPVLLAENQAHENLVQKDRDYLFLPKKNINPSIITSLIENYEFHSIQVRSYAAQQRNSFFDDWSKIIRPLL